MVKNTPNTTLDDKEFLEQLENLTLDPCHFSHLGHLRLAWLCLNDMGTENAVIKVCTIIKNYAESLGAHKKFNLAVTDAFVRIMATRMNKGKSGGWVSFLRYNPDLVEDALSVLEQYFSQKTLARKDVQTSLNQPDINTM